jgi:methylated-DNA-[protein]-cysteine S-methyltransferase
VDADPMATAFATLPSPWGPVQVAATTRGLLGLELRASPYAFEHRLGERVGGPIRLVDATIDTQAGRNLAMARLRLALMLGGDAVDLVAVPLDWTGIKAWDRRVLEGARTIGRGEVTSYGRLARRIGAPGAARAVGAALGRNPFWLFVPCHRVVAGDGSLGGYGDDPDALDIKRDLLAREGIALPITRLVD